MTDRIFIKGFDKNLCCRGYQFEIGKEYKIDLPEGYKLSDKDLCSDKVFHFCDGLSKVHNYYSCADENNRFCIIEVLGQFCENGDKCGSNHIKIIREIVGEELRIARGLTNGNTGLCNSGDCNSGDCNTGDCNTGYHNSGDCNSGYRNSGDYNSGDYNSGHRNSGHCNSGHYNSGNDNSGNYNSGHRNSGNHNSGHYNSGYRNVGVFNKTNNSNGIFCNNEPKICIFNIQTDWTLSEFYASKYWDAIMSSDFPLTELEENSLKKNTYEEACRRWWSGMSEANKAIIKDIPNFDIDVFCDITGIDKKDV